MKTIRDNEAAKPSKLRSAARTALRITERVLIGLSEFSDDMEFARRFPYASLGGGSIREARYYYEDLSREIEERQRKRALRILRARKLIIVRKEGDRAIYGLTEAGKAAALRSTIKYSPRRLPAGKTLVISFDIPEAARNARYAFRRFLKKSGFAYVHGSVWSTDRDIGREMVLLAQSSKVDKWVKIFICDRLL